MKINEEYSFEELANNLDKKNKKMLISVNDIESESIENNDKIKNKKKLYVPIVKEI